MTEFYEEIVDTMNAISGVHPGYRAAHAKGVFLSGRFTGSAETSGLTRAAHMSGVEVPVTARFSNGGGDPTRSDHDRREGRGLAVKFHLPDGGATDIVCLTLPAFFVRTPEEFLEFAKARVPDPETGEIDMERIGAFIAKHPATGAALGAILPALIPPVSYATRVYNSLHAYAFENADGARQFIRYRLEPEAGEANLPEDEVEDKDDNYLGEELRDRIAAGPIAFTLTAVLATDDDPVDDATIAWPEERERVVLGRLELTGFDTDAEADGGVIVFDPVNVTDGIECSDDPILEARSKAYSVSVERRIAARQG